jgi:hypothetical protein
VSRTRSIEVNRFGSKVSLDDQPDFFAGKTLSMEYHSSPGKFIGDRSSGVLRNHPRVPEIAVQIQGKRGRHPLGYFYLRKHGFRSPFPAVSVNPFFHHQGHQLAKGVGRDGKKVNQPRVLLNSNVKEMEP